MMNITRAGFTWSDVLSIAAKAGVFGVAGVAIDAVALGGTFTGNVLTFITSAFTEQGSRVLEFIMSAIPDGVSLDYSVIAPYINVLSDFIPIDFGLVLLASFYGFKWVYILANFVIKCIPGVG